MPQHSNDAAAVSIIAILLTALCVKVIPGSFGRAKARDGSTESRPRSDRRPPERTSAPWPGAGRPSSQSDAHSAAAAPQKLVMSLSGPSGLIDPSPGANLSFVCRGPRSDPRNNRAVVKIVRVLSFSNTKSAYFRSCSLFRLAGAEWEFRLDLFEAPKGTSNDLVKKRQWAKSVLNRTPTSDYSAPSIRGEYPNEFVDGPRRAASRLVFDFPVALI